jgi:dipeptidyl aminopeptidase/acylaminoacyl peptidase
MRRSDTNKPYAALAVMLLLLVGPQSGSASEKAELRLLDQKSAGSTNDCTHELIRPDGTRLRIEDPGCTAVLSPDGSKVALRSHERKMGLVLYDAGKDTYFFAITFLAGTDVGKFVWSLDSSALAFTTVNQDAPDYPTKSKLFIYDMLMKKKVKVDVQAFRSCGAACVASTPSWSPDGKKISVVEIDRAKMLNGKGPFERDVEFDRSGKRLTTSPWH